MAHRGSDRLRDVRNPRRPQLISPAVLGTLLFVIAEAMLFMGLISAYMIVTASAPGGWPPPDQPRLPVEATALNTGALLLSAVFLAAAHRTLARSRERAWGPLLGAILLGALFVIFQGVEWVGLIRQGLTLTSSPLGSFFYLIVGMHGLHAIAALGALCWVWVRLMQRALRSSTFFAAEVFWYFVVGLWPILYLKVYL